MSDLPTKPLELPNAKLTISRPSGTDTGYITIRVMDGDSGSHFVDVKVPYEEFALAITGMGHVDCSAVVRGLNRLGLVRENKSEVITLPPSVSRVEQDDEINDLLAPYEVDGWIGNRDDFKNWHRRSRSPSGNTITVSFQRWVRKADGS